MRHVSDRHKQREVLLTERVIPMRNHFDNHRGHHLLVAKSDTQSAQTVMAEAGALFDVTYQPAGFVDASGDLCTPRAQDGKYTGKPLNKYVVRPDTNKILGLHSYAYPEWEGYSLIADMAETMFPNSATSCTLFGGGEKVALTQDLIDPVEIGPDDVIQPQICWLSSLNGSWSTAVYDLNYRLFCQNQLISETPLIKVKHSKNHDALLEMRINILEGARRRAGTFSTMAKIMRDQEFADAQFEHLVSVLLPIDHKEMTERMVDLRLTSQGACRSAWKEERQEWGPGNKWMAYNAVQGAEQHRLIGRNRKGHHSKVRALELNLNGKAPLAKRAMDLLHVQ